MDTLRELESDLGALDDVDTLISDASGKTALDDQGTQVGITVVLLNAQVYFMPQTAPRNVGVATSNTTEFGRGIYLIDTNATFQSDGVERGDTLFNSTTGAMASVLEVNSETQILAMGLTGGSRADWHIGDGWSIYDNQQCSISGGNVVAVDLNGDFISSVLESPNAYVVRTSSSSATLQELATIQYASFNSGVTIDVANGAAGTAYPQGTAEHPVNNLVDAIAIAQARGFVDLYVRGNLTLGPTDNISNYHLYGQGASINIATTTLTMFAGCITENSRFHALKVTGTQGGEVNYYDCVIENVSDTHSSYVNCVLKGTLHQKAMIDPTHVMDMHDCHTGPDGVIIDQNGAQVQTNLTNFSGKIQFTNGTHAGALVVVNLDSGEVGIDSSCTAGTYVIQGTGDLINNAAGAIVSAAALSSEQAATSRYTTESLRSTHQGFGEVFFVDPVDGSDTNLGTSPTTAKKTVTATLSECVSGRGDVIYLVSPGAGVATITEQIVITKNDVFLRGSGRGIQFQPPSQLGGAVITIDADNCSLAAFIVRAPVGSTTDDCIRVNGKFSRMDKLYVVGSQTGAGNGIVFRGGDYHEMNNMEVEKCGGDGVLFTDAGLGSGSPREVTINGGNYYLNNGNGIHLTATSNNSTRLVRIDNCRINNNVGYGVRIDADVQRTYIGSNNTIFQNTAGTVLDDGTETQITATDNPWDVPTGSELPGTMGERLKKIKQDTALVPGLM